MNVALRSEYRKFVTTRLWWVLLLVMAAYMAFIGIFLGWSIGAGTAGLAVESSSPGADLASPDSVRSSVYGTAAAFGYVFPVIIGALSMTGEYRHQTITPTFLASPSRTRVLVAKMIAALPIGIVYGTVATLATVGAGAAGLALGGSATLLGDGETWTLVARSVLALTVWAPVGVALGSILTNQVLAIIVILVYTQFLEAVLRLGLTQVGDVGASVASYLPGAAGEAITGGSVFSSAGIADVLPWGAGLAVLAGYALVLAAVGSLTTLRRDVS
ncbi:ABC transporter permease [Sanguibacter inulinus]|uniref:ABC transporter permease n=1 Tax=Sanguibacter inulinus TaxID=60922 RepID=A0A853EUW4_9MICO|nr:ABC transporter permease [Sanguibacter inulinus]MBF0723361.1 ABC transporter permease [Sanguibacter inulinus]NYS94506.1 ABC transporter permease [Sanguibacter inulinus]